jgi:hypothetical protein
LGRLLKGEDQGHLQIWLADLSVLMKTPIASVPAILKTFLLSLPLEETFSKSVLERRKQFHTFLFTQLPHKGR